MTSATPLMIMPERNVLSTCPAAICAAVIGETSMSLPLPDVLSSIMVCRTPAEVVTGRMPIIPARTQQSKVSAMPLSSGYEETRASRRNSR